MGNSKNNLKPYPSRVERRRDGITNLDPHPGRIRRLITIGGGAVVVVIVAALIGMGVLLGVRVRAAMAATERLRPAIAARDWQAGCAEIAYTADAWQDAANVSRPLAPILRHSGWVPYVGRDMVLLPDLVDAAQAGTEAGVRGCTLIAPIAPATSTPVLVKAVTQQLAARPNDLAAIELRLQNVQRSLAAALPQLDRSTRVAPYRDSVVQANERVPQLVTALATVRELGPHLPWLLGVDEPRRFLLVSHNPFELRPTGGFLGIVCVVQVQNAHANVETCENSAVYDVVAPAGSPMPDAYSRYLRLSEWRLRDANWSPDFPESARRIEWFWTLNNQRPVDGVIAVDPYALVPLLKVTGPLVLEDGTRVGADEIVDTMLTHYYDGAVFADKERLSALLPRVLERVQQMNVTQLPDVAQSVRYALDERHVQVMLHNEQLQAFMAHQGWDGGMRAHSGNMLRVVDADVGYGDVNAFIDRLTQHDVALDEHGAPLTTTLTLTYTNRYSSWAEAPTAHAAYGNCADPATLQLERVTGCYANYLRAYVPHGSHLLGIDGVDASLGTQVDAGRMVFGGYIRLDPGEQRVVQLRYRVPNGMGETLVVEKQGGTRALPIVLTAHTSTKHAELWTSGRTDLAITYRLTPLDLLIDGLADATIRDVWARQAAVGEGVAFWQQGQHEAALETWQHADAVPWVLDHAYALAATGSTAEAQALFAALEPVASDGRAAFEQAVLFDMQGDTLAADRLYHLAAQRSPDHPLAQLTWARRLAQQDQPLPDLQHLSVAAGVRRWRQAIDTLEQQGKVDDARVYADVLRRVTPDDHALLLRYADLLEQTGKHEAALKMYAELAPLNDLWGTLAAARAAQLRDVPAEAAQLYVRALPLVTTYAQAMQVAYGLRDVGDIATAQRAYERAAQLSPRSVVPFLSIGHLVRTTDPAAARMWYERAQRVDPNNGYPDHAIATLLLDAGDPVAARPYAEAAIAKDPHNEQFHALRDRFP